jgi:hypothetical protein
MIRIADGLVSKLDPLISSSASVSALTLGYLNAVRIGVFSP